MNYYTIFHITGDILIFLALFMLIPLITGIYFKEYDFIIFLFISLIILIIGIILKNNKKQDYLSYKEGFIVVTINWLIISIFGAFPYLLSGVINNPIDAIFESISGFTTTGATIIITVESLSKTMLMWRSLTHWLGGMGIIVMYIAILPEIAGNMYLYQAEVPGPVSNVLKPRLKESSRIIILIYILLTISEIILLKLNGMNLFDSIIHSFSTISTGGFSSKSFSIKSYNNIKIEIIIALFMFISATNFTLIYHLFTGKIIKIFKDEEFKLYTLIIIITTIFISINLLNNPLNNINHVLRYSYFQVISIISTTGFATFNYDNWPPFSRFILLVLMFIGGSSGSTAGGIKIIRFKILFKKGMQELFYLIHPKAIKKITINGQIIPDSLSTGILGFFYLYILVFIINTIFLTYLGIDIISSISAVAATLGNIGPGLKLVGPINTFYVLPPLAKLLLSICMILGRLEIYTILVFFFIDWH